MEELPYAKEKPPYAKLAKLLADKLREKQLTQQALADRFIISQAAVNFWMKGHKRPHPAYVALLVRYLDLDLQELAAATHYTLEEITLFFLYPPRVPDKCDPGERLLRQIHETMKDNPEEAMKKLHSLSQWIAGSSHRAKSPFENLPPLKDNLMKQREAEERVLKELDSRWPIVAIEGPSGSSKSTLAIQVGWRCLVDDRRPLQSLFQAVVWISAKDQPGQKWWLDAVVDKVAQVLNYRYISNLSHQDKLRDGLELLSHIRTLLIIDNFETIKDPDLEEWLQKVPEPSKVLITTLPNQLRSARLVPLHGLSRDESLLFIQQHTHQLALQVAGGANGPSERSLVKFSAGNPKVMEVALGIAKYNQLSLNEIITHLQSTTEAGKQLETFFAIAWKGLSRSRGQEDEIIDSSALSAAQRVLVVILFFVESVSKEALAAVARVTDAHLDLALTQLVELGLVDVHRFAQSGAVRFSIHPAVRAFVSKELAQMPELEAQARADWYGYFLWYVEQYGDDDHGECIGYGIEGHREKLTAELPNIRATIEWCFWHRPEKAVRLVERMTTYLLDEGFFRERLDLSQRAYRMAITLKMWESLVGLLVRKGWTELVMGEWDTAEQTYRQAITLAWEYNVADRSIQARRDLGHLFALRGTIATGNGGDESSVFFAEADRLIAESFALAQETGDTLGILEARAFAARVAYLRGDVTHLHQAKRAFVALLSECQAVRHWRHLLFIHRYLAQIALKEGDIATAQQHLSLANDTLHQRYYEAHEEAQNTECRGDIEAAHEDLDHARATYTRARDLTLRLGMKKEEARIALKLQKLATTHERLL